MYTIRKYNITKKWLVDNYVKGKKSTHECAKMIGCNQRVILARMDEYGIKRRPENVKGSKMPEHHKKAISEHHKNDPNWHTKGKYSEEHYRWKGGVRVYRTKKLSTVPLVCSNCGAKEIVRKRSNLYVHHIDEDRSNNSLDNLQVLCASCHRKVHNLSKPD